jgi:hypothetical protein
MGDFNQRTMKRLFGRRLLAGALMVCLHAAQTAWSADPSDSTPPESPSAPGTPPTHERQGSMRAGMQKFRQACEADIKQFCGNIQPGGGRIIQCLESHAKEVSETCHETLEKRGQRGPR